MEKGPASPGRWQVWQCFCRIGATSLVKVTVGMLPICADRLTAKQIRKASMGVIRLIGLGIKSILQPAFSRATVYMACPRKRCQNSRFAEFGVPIRSAQEFAPIHIFRYLIELFQQPRFESAWR